MSGKSGPPKLVDPNAEALAGSSSGGSAFNPDVYLASNQRGPTANFDPETYLKPELDEQKYGGLSGEMKASAAGLARGASFGLSDQALTNSGLVNPETLKGLRDTNPASTIGSELVGAIAPAFVGDEAGLANLPKTVASIGRGVEGSAGLVGAGSTVAKAAGFGAEGALYGLGQGVSENALGDHDLVSQQTLADMGMSAALAGGLGGLVGKFSGDGAKALNLSGAEDSIAAQKISESVNPLTPEGALVNNNLPAKDKISMFEALRAQKANAADIIKAGEEIGAPVLPAQTSSSKYIQDATSSLSKTPSIPGVITQQAIQKGVDAVDGTIKSVLGAGEQLSAYDAGALVKQQIQEASDAIYAPIKEAYAERAALGKTINLPDEARIKLWEGLQEQAQKFGSVGSDGSKLIETYAEKALSQNTVDQLDQLIKEMKSKQSVAYRAGDTEAAQALGQVSESIQDFQIRQIAKQGRDIGSGKTPTFAGGDHPFPFDGAEEKANQAINQHKELTAKYKDFKEILNSLASDQRLGKKANTHGGLENVLDGLANEKVIDRMFDPKNADGLARLKKNFPEVFQTIIEQKKSQILQSSMEDGSLKVNKVLKSIYDESKLSSKVREMMFSQEELKKLGASKTWMDALPKDINPSGTSKAEAYRELLTNPLKATSQNFLGYATQKLIEHFAGTPGEAEKIMTLSNTQKAADKTAARIKFGVSDILGDSKRIPIEKAFSKIANEEDYNKKTSNIAEMAANEHVMQEKLEKSTQSIYNHAPQIAGAAQRTMVRGIQFLNSKIPSSHPEGIFQAPPKPSATQIAQFKRYYDVVEDPVSALKQVKNNTITSEAMEALQAVHPDLYEHMKTQMLTAIGKIKDKTKIPYQTKQAVSQFMGAPLDPSLTFESVMGNQAMFAQAVQQPQASPKPTAGGLKGLTVANRTGVSTESNI